MRVYLPPVLLYITFVLIPSVIADPISIPIQDCFDDSQSSSSQKFDVNTVYGQVLQNEEFGRYLNLTVIGNSPQDIVGSTNRSGSLATLFTTSSVLTLNAWSNSSYLCQNMRPQSPLPELTSLDGTFCPIASGPFAFSSTIPWGRDRELTTLITRLRAVDPFGKELLCLDMLITPLNPRVNSPYGNAKIIFWSTVGLAIAYWIVVGIARIVSAWNRGITRPGRGLWSRAQSAGYILASAISGERLATSPALMRFCTPSMRDVIFHTQWCAILAMVAVEWPQFVYPLLTQTAWSTLSYNISLTQSSQSHHWDPLNTSRYSPPDGFADQLSDSQSPIFIDPSVPNVIYSLPPDATHGISSFAYTLGIRPQDLFPTCMIIFLGIIAAAIVISILICVIDYTVGLFGGSGGGQGHGTGMNRLTRSRSPAFGSKELGDAALPSAIDESKSLTGSAPGLSASGKFPNAKFSLPLPSSGVSSERGINSHRSWWRLRSDFGAFHGSVLHGNLVRILVLFHLPVTVFSCYQMTLKDVVGTSSIVLAALSFVIFSILVPAHLVIRVTFTTTNKLYDETKTLLSLGPLYNHYRHGSQLFASLFFATNIAFGVTVGAGQKSGTAQAIIILVVEVISALVTSIWLPWGSGASMGLISFLFCVARIVIAVLLVILTQAISIGPGPGGWVAYGILIILALVYLALIFMLAVKLLEALVRIVGRVGFDRSRHVVDSGLLGACGLLGCCGSRKRSRRNSRRRHSHRRKMNNTSPSQIQTRDSDLSSYMPPVGGIQPIDGTSTPPRFLNTESRKGSANSQPPSVLRPEHANRPYKEELVDSEDEGYIMGAWQPFPRPASGYTPVSNVPQIGHTPQPKASPSSNMSNSVPTSGFSRVGGGRAHIDTPYAINTGSTHTFPSIGQHSQVQPVGNQSTSALGGSPLFYERGMDSDENIPLSVANVEVAVGVNGLPSGAMMPVHTRTKSQTAIIDYLPSGPASSQSMSRVFQQQQDLGQSSLGPRQTHVSEDTFLRPPEAMAAHKFVVGDNDVDDDDDSGDEQNHKKRKPWYRLRRNRPHSMAGGQASTPNLGKAAVDEELGGLNTENTPQPQKSFVVIRKPPSASMGRLNAAAPSSGANTSATYPKASSRPPTR
ncbi:hypothetical protein JR316_0004399 [Psilocybe cubensis]|uniref:TRP C-terminal domain-containing protein n=2 Tax=Psilocybe cubensis TaxID=181762 RepID=A0A8H7Y0E2_PSICU|nr:hypothetical protein JR316_0004399 [Psilocybe cubensis]KAH9482301.1 hypothetical protein JR316_0004399 [Psilocybe cubensis]